MTSVHPNLDDFKHIAAGLFTLASSVTCFRFYVRFTKRHWWWDDTLALISMLFMSLFVAGAAVVDQASRQPRRIQIFAYYLVVIGYYIPIWAARLSILCNIIRIAPWPRQQKFLSGCACFFVLQWTFLMVQVFWVCEITLKGWKSQEGELCFLGKAVPICQVITTIISDLILIFSPIWLIRKVRLDPGLRFRLVSAFFVSIATTVAAVAHSVLVIRMPGAWEAIFGAVEVAVALTVCNASVLIPFIARSFSNNEAFQESPSDPSDIVATIGGSNRRKRGNTTRLSTLRIGNFGTTDAGTTVQVDVTVEQDRERSEGWDKHKRSSTDGDSFELPHDKTPSGLV